MGIHLTLSEPFIPPNHTSAAAHPDFIQDYITKEHTGHQYTGLFSCSCLKQLIRYFRTSPL
ncbi:hypothetical protein DFH08DRAFT_637860, partial [Mycena albidolilacea]